MSSRRDVGGGGDFRSIGKTKSCGRFCVDAVDGIILKEVGAAVDDANADRSTVAVKVFPLTIHFSRSLTTNDQ